MAVLRYEQGLTLREVGAKISVSDSLIGMIEQGDATPSLETLIKLAEVYGCTIDYLLFGKR